MHPHAFDTRTNSANQLIHIGYLLLYSIAPLAMLLIHAAMTALLTSITNRPLVLKYFRPSQAGLGQFRPSARVILTLREAVTFWSSGHDFSRRRKWRTCVVVGWRPIDGFARGSARNHYHTYLSRLLFIDEDTPVVPVLYASVIGTISPCATSLPSANMVETHEEGAVSCNYLT